MHRIWIVSALFLAAQGAPAEVTDSGPAGFSLQHTVTIAAERDVVWRAAVADVGSWWSDAHTISGNAGRMHIDAVPLGCFCETLGENAGAVHLTVTFVNPGVLLRMTGGLGPLGLMGVEGNMLWEFSAADGATSVSFSYAVGGYHAEGLDSMAEPVDYVIGEALLRLKAFVETGDPDGADAR